MTLLSVAPLFIGETEAGRNSIVSISEIVCCPCIRLQFPNVSKVGVCHVHLKYGVCVMQLRRMHELEDKVSEQAKTIESLNVQLRAAKQDSCRLKCQLDDAVLHATNERERSGTRDWLSLSSFLSTNHSGPCKKC